MIWFWLIFCVEFDCGFGYRFDCGVCMVARGVRFGLLLWVCRLNLWNFALHLAGVWYSIIFCGFGWDLGFDG